MMKEKLLITIIIDNSLALGEDHLASFKSAFQKFLATLRSKDHDHQIMVELIAYKDFAPVVVKSFKETNYDISLIEYGMMPFFDRAMNKALTDLADEIAMQRNEGGIYKPWIVTIVDSKTFDKDFDSLSSLTSMAANKMVTYFPFKTRHTMSPKFKKVTDVKGFIEIRDYNFTGLFNWLSEMALDRISLPSSENIQLKRDAFKGWTTLS